MNSKFTIGYIDEDPKQVKKYKRKLKEYFYVIDYDIKKETTLESLMEQVYKSDIDLLMIDFKLNETNILAFNGDVVESLIYDNKPLFPHIIFTNNADDSETKDKVEDWKIIFDKTKVFSSDEEIEKLQKEVEKLKQQSKDNLNIDCKIKINKKRHQYKGSECGMYCIYFITSLLDDKTFETVVKNIIDSPIIDILKSELNQIIILSKKYIPKPNDAALLDRL